ncbi:uncharacterized protein LOC108671210 [Hyalella azteca]|uniref:Uncharacterized protein LOC108671210 n=1 Tax=Hyalella azteca TaxID=294128 RepID=A0A8B7NLS5_HYAAZ|nr:uncharacterized protein LOC108671210 [Hyalella azteca]
MAAQMLSSLQSDARQKLESGTYSLMQAPLVMAVDSTNQVYLHKDGPNQDVVKCLQGQDDWSSDKVLTPKLKASSFGDYDFSLGLIPSIYFESREKFDSLYSQEWQDAEPFDPNKTVETVEKIPFEEALKQLTVTLSCNMEYYLANRDEMEQDLGRKLDSFNAEDESFMKRLERELFYNQVIKIVGESEDDDKATCSVMLKDFKNLFYDGNDTYATARRGDHYLIFQHATS